VGGGVFFGGLPFFCLQESEICLHNLGRFFAKKHKNAIILY